MSLVMPKHVRNYYLAHKSCLSRSNLQLLLGEGYHRLVMEGLVLQPSVNGIFPKKVKQQIRITGYN